MRKRSLRIALFVVVNILATLTTSWAQDCTSTVVDGARVFGSQLGLVEDAARKLQNAGAEVYVRTFPNWNPASSLEGLEERLRMSCSNWRQPNSSRAKENLIEILIAVENRRTGIYYGSLWNDTLNPRREGIINKVMNPQFLTSNFAQGFVLGINQVQNLVEDQINSVSAPPQQQPTPPTQQLPPVVVERQTQPMDLSGLWSVLGWIVSIVFLVVIGFVLWNLFREFEKRRNSRLKALAKKQTCAATITTLHGSLDELHAICHSYAKHVSVQTANSLLNIHAKANKILEEAEQEFADLTQQGRMLEKRFLSLEEYSQVEESYDSVLKKLQEAQQLHNQLNTGLRNLEFKLSTLEPILAGAKSAILLGKQTMEEAKAAGLKPGSAEGLLAEAETILESAQSQKAAGQPETAVDTASLAKTKAQEATKTISEIPAKKQQAENRIAKAPSNISAAKQSVLDGRQVFILLENAYADQVLEPVKGNGSRATRKIAESEQHLVNAMKASSMGTQAWDEALKELDELDRKIEQSQSLMRSLTALQTSLDQARADAQPTIDSTKSDIIAATKYIKDCEATNPISSGVKSKLQEARILIKQSETEIRKSKPDYLEVVKFARRAHDMVDELLRGARTEHENFLRLQEKARDTLNTARARVSKAREYHEDHSRKIKSSSRNTLENAEERLRRAEQTTDYNAIIILASEADDFGKSAYTSAKDDVAVATQSRSSSWDSSSSYRSSSSGSRSSSGGGSSDWGSSSFSSSISGGSSDFGSSSSSSDVGGGSSSW
jgi:uncharacterized membrane protein YgcG